MSDNDFKHNQTPPELRDNFRINSIKKIVTEIQQVIETLEKKGISDPFEFEMKIMESHPGFYQSNPFLVKKLCKKEDISMLYKMLESLHKVETGDQTLASVEMNLGNELANKYIYPNLNK
jgi:hypothetical protein